ncbi:hypothetical protein GEV43_43130 [Actinomadura sp. J1-007]|nr:hypothetical protein [Actinomadura sp. J1-007]
MTGHATDAAPAAPDRRAASDPRAARPPGPTRRAGTTPRPGGARSCARRGARSSGGPTPR